MTNAEQAVENSKVDPIARNYWSDYWAATAAHVAVLYDLRGKRYGSISDYLHRLAESEQFVGQVEHALSTGYEGDPT